MTTTSSTIGVTSSSSTTPGFTLQDTQISIGIIASLVVLSGVAVSIVSKINKISFTVDGIQETLKLHASNAEKIKDLEKHLAIHQQDYVNYKEANLVSHSSLSDLIDHNWQRSESESNAIKGSRKELQGFLHRTNDFKVRE
ncbi:MAG: hypothetical protein HWQ43_12210 [Nostoc sp. JL31]|uniref:hypothetical protein n=1 Tax=Nostoc sp. JL31 TaxID=2815395 RepID=UPI0025DE6A07|nr:hypothetical protein [Nostoc sp. JL31]MBN3889900.1 hypothetical protein [Nostoc sp. JL31]